MKHNHSLPPSPYGAGTTYTGREKRVVSPDTQAERISPKIAKSAGAVAVERTVMPPRIAREVQTTDHEQEAHLRRLFAFPDTADDRMYMRTSVTKESIKDALDAYIATDDDIKEVINNLTDGGYMRQQEVAEVLRSNDVLRFELGKHLLTKLDAMQFLPSRLNNDTEVKRPNVQGYDEPMTSKEYAVLLALSMLDGTYKDSTGDKIYIDRYRDVKNGQHRYAAQELLGIGKIARNREYQQIT